MELCYSLCSPDVNRRGDKMLSLSVKKDSTATYNTH